jgi:hypothetical protein
VDLDGNGNDELIVTSNDSLWVLLGLGAGSYAPPASIHTGLVPRDVGDVDGDGKVDLLVTDASLRAQILPGNGAGGLGPAVDYAFTFPFSPEEGGARVADVDGNGRADLLFPTRTPQSLGYVGSEQAFRGWLQVALNDAAGHFAPADSFSIDWQTLGGGRNLTRLAIGNFDGDSFADVQVTGTCCGCDSQGFWGTLRGLGGGDFLAVGSATSAGNSPCDLAAGDLNGDGLADLVRTNGSGGFTMNAVAFAATGGGAFTPTASGDMGDYPSQVFLADMDGDGKPDVVTRSSRTNTGSIRRNLTVYDVPTPAQLALVAAWIEDGAAWLDWHAPGGVMTASLERRTEASGWSLLAPVRFDGTGNLRYVDRALPEAGRLGYRLRWSDAEGVRLTAETWLEREATAFGLRGAPNPASATPSFAIVLPRSGSADLEVFDLGGRRVARERRAELAAGPQRVELTSVQLAPGVYVARLTFAGRRLESRFVVLE